MIEQSSGTLIVGLAARVAVGNRHANAAATMAARKAALDVTVILRRVKRGAVRSLGPLFEHGPKRKPRPSGRGQARQCSYGAEGAPVLWRGSSRLQAGVTHASLALTHFLAAA